MKFLNVKIKGSGIKIPENVISNESIEIGNTTSEWINTKLGIHERRIAPEDETTSELGYHAAIRAIDDAGINKEDLDLIIVATSSPEKISPSTACIIHNKLDIKKDVPAFDVNAVCSGFVYAVTVGASFISSGMYKNVLVIGTETYSKITDWDDRNRVFFGDGAGAVVLGQSEKGWISSELSANGNGTGMTGFHLEPGKKFVMNGKEVWEQAVKVLPTSIKSILSKNNVDVSEISLLVPHQPSINILKIVANEVGLPMEKVKTVMDKYANIAGASVPIAFHEAKEEGQIKKGDKILFTAIGSGWTWGSILINYED